MAWKLLHKIDKVLFAQMIVTQMLSKHRILTQVAGHAMDVLKILPPLIIGEKKSTCSSTRSTTCSPNVANFPVQCGNLETISSAPRLVRDGQVKRLRACPRLLDGTRRFDILRLAAKRVAPSCANSSSLSLSIFRSGVRFELSQEERNYHEHRCR